MSLEIASDPIYEDHSFSFVNTGLVDKFYKFMADIYIEYQKLKIKQTEDLLLEKEVKPLLQSFP